MEYASSCLFGRWLLHRLRIFRKIQTKTREEIEIEA